MPALAEILAFLQADPLKYIVHLKMLDAYAGVMTWLAEPGGVILLLPAAANPYDAQTYPQADWIVLPAVQDTAAAARLLAQIPRDARLVFKTVDGLSRDALLAAFPVRRVTGFVSYTCAEGDFPPDPQVALSTQLDPRLLPCYQSNGYTLAELERSFAQGSQSFSLFAPDGAPLSTCFFFKNYDPVWEVGGVYTAPDFRRQGLGRRVVAMALRELLGTARVPRYQVKETNRASCALAESLGMHPFVFTEHYEYIPLRG